METKFTKGNWYPVQYGPYFNIQDDEYYDTGLNLLNADEIDSNEAAANALLASKSPLLLEALQQCVNLIKDSNTDCFSWPDRIIAKELIQRAEQLIMDATNI